MPTLTTEQLLEQALGNTDTNAEVEQASGNNKKPSKALGINISIINPTKKDPSLFLGSAFSIDVGFLEPYKYSEGLPQQNGDSVKAQIFHLSVQRQHEEFSLMKDIADNMLANDIREHTIDWDKLDSSKYPFTIRTWGKSGMVWHFTNRKLAKPAGDKLDSDKVEEVLADLL